MGRWNVWAVGEIKMVNLRRTKAENVTAQLYDRVNGGSGRGGGDVGGGGDGGARGGRDGAGVAGRR